jgi:hypothetical protein
MDIAALAAWVVTALGGFVLLARWIARGGLRGQQTGVARFPAPLVFGHFLLAAAGLVVWIVYLAADKGALAWTSFGILVAVALLGFTMFARWIPVHREMPNFVAREAKVPAAVPGGVFDGGSQDRPVPGGEPPAAGVPAGESVPAEGNFPVVVVAAHGLLAVSTLVLAVIAALGPPVVLARGS